MFHCCSSEADAQGFHSPRSATIKGLSSSNLFSSFFHFVSLRLTSQGFCFRHTSYSQTTKASLHRVKVAAVLVCTCYLVSGERPDVFPLPAAVRLRAAGRFHASAACRPGYYRVCAVLLGVHHRV